MWISFRDDGFTQILEMDEGTEYSCEVCKAMVGITMTLSAVLSSETQYTFYFYDEDHALAARYSGPGTDSAFFGLNTETPGFFLEDPEKPIIAGNTYTCEIRQNDEVVAVSESITLTDEIGTEVYAFGEAEVYSAAFTLTGSTLTVDALTNTNVLLLDSSSEITFSSIVNTGKITIAGAAPRDGVVRLFNYTGTESLTEDDYRELVSNYADYASSLRVVGSDLFLGNAGTTCYFNSEWYGQAAEGEKVADGFYYMVNAFSRAAELPEEAGRLRIVFLREEEILDSAVTAGSVFSDGTISLGSDLTLTGEGGTISSVGTLVFSAGAALSAGAGVILKVNGLVIDPGCDAVFTTGGTPFIRFTGAGSFLEVHGTLTADSSELGYLAAAENKSGDGTIHVSGGKLVYSEKKTLETAFGTISLTWDGVTFTEVRSSDLADFKDAASPVSVSGGTGSDKWSVSYDGGALQDYSHVFYDMGGGVNTLVIAGKTDFALGGLANISTLSVKSGIRSDFTRVSFGDISFSNGTGTAGIGDYSVFEAGHIAGSPLGSSVKLTFGNAAAVSAQSISSLASFTLGNTVYAKNGTGGYDTVRASLTVDGDVSGQYAACRISAGSNTVVSVGGTLDLAAGKNTLSFGSNAAVSLHDTAGVTALTLAKGIYQADNAGDVSLKTQRRTSAEILGNFVSGEYACSISLGAFADFSVTGTLAAERGAGISAGANASVVLGTDGVTQGSTVFSGMTSLSLGASSQYLAVSTDPVKTQGQTSFRAYGDVTGTHSANSISLGARSVAEIGGKTDLLGGANSVSLAAAASLTVSGDLTGVQKLTLADGKSFRNVDGTSACLWTSAVIGGSYAPARANNSVSLGSFCVLTIAGTILNGGVTSGVGTSVTVGSNSVFIVGTDGVTQNAAVFQGVSSLTLKDSSQYFSASTEVLKTQGQTAFTAYGDVLGTASGNTVSLGRLSSAEIDGNMDLLGGKNTLKLAFGAGFALSGDLADVTAVSLASGGFFRTVGGMNSLARTSAAIGGAYTGSMGKNTISLGNYADLAVAGDISGDGRTYAVTLGTASTMTAGNISGLTALTLGGGNAGGFSVVNAGSVSGTAGADKISLGKYAVLTVGNLLLGEGDDSVSLASGSSAVCSGEFDLGGGGNTVSIAASASLRISGGLSGVRKLTLADGNASSSARLTAGGVTGTDGADTFTFGAFSAASVDGIALGAGKNTLSAGRDARIAAGEISGVYKLTLAASTAGAGLQSFTADGISGTEYADSVSIGANCTFAAAGGIDLLDGLNTFSAGANSAVTVGGGISGIYKLSVASSAVFAVAGGLSGTASADTVSIGKSSAVSFASIDLKEGMNKIELGASASLSVFGQLSGADTLTLGGNASLSAGSVSGIRSARLGAGTAVGGAQLWTCLDADAVDFDSGSGIPSLILDDHSRIRCGSVDFAGGKLTVSKNAKAAFLLDDGGTAVNPGETVLNAGAELYATSDAYDALAPGVSGSGTLYDIGSSACASAFTDRATEAADDLPSSKSILTAGSNGWLHYEEAAGDRTFLNDIADYFGITGVSEVRGLEGWRIVSETDRIDVLVNGEVIAAQQDEGLGVYIWTLSDCQLSGPSDPVSVCVMVAQDAVGGYRTGTFNYTLSLTE